MLSEYFGIFIVRFALHLTNAIFDYANGMHNAVRLLLFFDYIHDNIVHHNNNCDQLTLSRF